MQAPSVIIVRSESQKLIVDKKRIVSCRFDLDKNNVFFKFNTGHSELIKNVTNMTEVWDWLKTWENPKSEA